MLNQTTSDCEHFNLFDNKLFHIDVLTIVHEKFKSFKFTHHEDYLVQCIKFILMIIAITLMAKSKLLYLLLLLHGGKILKNYLRMLIIKSLYAN